MSKTRQLQYHKYGKIRKKTSNITKLGYIYFHKYFNTPLDMTLSATCVDLFTKKAFLWCIFVYFYHLINLSMP